MYYQLQESPGLGARPTAPRVEKLALDASDDSTEPGLRPRVTPPVKGLRPRASPSAEESGLGSPRRAPSIDNALSSKSLALYGPVSLVRN